MSFIFEKLACVCNIKIDMSEFKITDMNTGQLRQFVDENRNSNNVVILRKVGDALNELHDKEKIARTSFRTLQPEEQILETKVNITDGLTFLGGNKYTNGHDIYILTTHQGGKRLTLKID